MTYLIAALENRKVKRVQFAAMAGVDKATVTRWTQRKVPAERVPEVSERTGFSRHELRPDLYPQEAA